MTDELKTWLETLGSMDDPKMSEVGERLVAELGAEREARRRETEQREQERGLRLVAYKKLEAAEARAVAAEEKLSSAKNFHRLICELAGWAHDDKDWLRDLACVYDDLRKSLAEKDAALAEVTKSRDEERIEAWGYEIEVGDLKATLSAQAKAIEALRMCVEALKRLRSCLEGESGTIKMESDLPANLEYGASCADGTKAIIAGEKVLACIPAPAATEKGEGA